MIYLSLPREQHLNKNRNTGYPALDPTANQYFSGPGWEIMYLCVVNLFCVFARSFLCVCIFHICVFDCKCKHLNRPGESIKTKTEQH